MFRGEQWVLGRVHLEKMDEFWVFPKKIKVDFRDLMILKFRFLSSKKSFSGKYPAFGLFFFLSFESLSRATSEDTAIKTVYVSQDYSRFVWFKMAGLWGYWSTSRSFPLPQDFWAIGFFPQCCRPLEFKGSPMTSPRRAEKLKALPTKRGLKSDSAASPGISRGEAQLNLSTVPIYWFTRQPIGGMLWCQWCFHVSILMGQQTLF